jgi:sulfate adenylyltransferase subunit 1
MSAIEKVPGLPPVADQGLLRFLTCGSVDDGKSTLIGRLLFDTKAILADTLAHIETTSQRRGLSAVDLSLLTDGLQAEREQGITIDVAYRYFTTGTRKYIIADAPGHEQYTRNMVTAASTANLAIILVDARKGVVTQTRRHSLVAKMMGIHHLVVAVNKMDLVDYDEGVFQKIKDDYLAFAQRVGLTEAHGDVERDIRFVPLSALQGDMVVVRGERLNWYNGPTMIEILESTPCAHCEHSEPFRFPVQYVIRPQASDDHDLHDYRGYAGRIESGTVKVGDEVTILPAGRVSRVQSIQIGGSEIGIAYPDQSVTILLEDDIDISRGDMIVRSQNGPQTVKELDGTLCWLAEAPMDRNRTYVVRHTTREVKARLAGIDYRIDVNTLEHGPSERLAMNDIARVKLRLAQPLFVDSYEDNRATGAFIVVDEATNNTVGAGMID